MDNQQPTGVSPVSDLPSELWTLSAQELRNLWNEDSHSDLRNRSVLRLEFQRIVAVLTYGDRDALERSIAPNARWVIARYALDDNVLAGFTEETNNFFHESNAARSRYVTGPIEPDQAIRELDSDDLLLRAQAALDDLSPDAASSIPQLRERVVRMIARFESEIREVNRIVYVANREGEEMPLTPQPAPFIPPLIPDATDSDNEPEIDPQFAPEETDSDNESDFIVPPPEAITDFVQALPRQHLSDCPADIEPRCHICGDLYADVGQARPESTEGESECAVCAPCGHVVGETCLLRWLQELNDQMLPGTCPHCRREFNYEW